MSTLYVDYRSCFKLPCANSSAQDVILCLKDSALVVPTDCPTPSDMHYEGAFAEATICQAYSSGDCSPATWFYRFSYDSAILADQTLPLACVDISGVFCKDCLTSWVDYKVGEEISIRENDDGTQTLITQHGCEFPISTVQLADGSVTTIKLADGAVTTPKIVDGAVTSDKISIPWQDFSSTINVAGDGVNTISGVIIDWAEFAIIDKVGFIQVEFTATLSGVASNRVGITLPFTLASTFGGLSANISTVTNVINGNVTFVTANIAAIRRYDDVNMVNGTYTWRVFGSCQLL